MPDKPTVKDDEITSQHALAEQFASGEAQRGAAEAKAKTKAEGKVNVKKTWDDMTPEQQNNYLPPNLLLLLKLGCLSDNPLKIIEYAPRVDAAKPVFNRDSIRKDSRAEAALKREKVSGIAGSKKRTALDDFVEVRKKDVEQLAYSNVLTHRAAQIGEYDKLIAGYKETLADSDVESDSEEATTIKADMRKAKKARLALLASGVPPPPSAASGELSA